MDMGMYWKQLMIEKIFYTFIKGLKFTNYEIDRPLKKITEILRNTILIDALTEEEKMITLNL